MKNMFSLLLVIILPAIANCQDNQDQFKSLHWLIGKWQGKQGDAVITETWVLENDLTMKGTGTVSVSGKIVTKEDLQIHQVGTHLGYIASPNESPPTFFTLVKKGEDQWVFENKEHDFPQIISYSRTGENSFVAKTEGINSQNETSSDEFNYSRIE